MNKVRAAIRTARSLMAKGNLGKELWASVIEVHPNLNDKETVKVQAALRKEIGILGQVAHDPNLYKNCKTAAKEKEASPNNPLMILTYRTPICGSCAYNRQGSCSLMGGKLVDGAEDISASTVVKASRILQREGADKEQINRVASSKLPANKKIAAMILIKNQPQHDIQKDLSGQAQSRRIAAMLDQTGVGLDIGEASRKGPGRTANRETDEIDGVFEEHSGDAEVSKTASRVGSMMKRGSLDVDDVVDHTPKRKIRMAAGPTLTMPDMKSLGRSANVVEEHVDQAQGSYNKLIRLSSKLLASGKMTPHVSSQIEQRLGQLKEHGAVANSRTASIETQIQALNGSLEY